MQLGQDNWRVKAEQHTAAPTKRYDLRRSSCSVLSNTPTTEVDHDYQQSQTSDTNAAPPHYGFQSVPGKESTQHGLAPALCSAFDQSSFVSSQR